MTDQTPPVDEMDYETMTHEALRTVIRDGLLRAASPAGLPGAHHFYITFKTRAADVSVPPDILAKYPDEMTVVIQHWFENLTVTHEGFAIALNFGNSPGTMVILFDAMRTFVDPSVEFGLRFETQDSEDEAEEAPEVPEAAPAEAPLPSGGAEVVSLDKWRK